MDYLQGAQCHALQEIGNPVRHYLIILLPLLTAASTAQNDPDSYEFDGYALGVTVRQLNLDDFRIADVPLIEARIPLSSEKFQLMYGGQLMWGLSTFFVEWYYGTGLIVYPVTEVVGISTSVRLGSFLMDNIAVIGAVGVTVDIPIGRYDRVSLEVEYFYRHSQDLIDFVSFPRHGNGGEEGIMIDSGGVGVGVVFRL